MPLRKRSRLATATKLTLISAGWFALSFAAMLALVLWLTERFMAFHIQESVDAEIHILKAEYLVDGLAKAGVLINQRIAMSTPDHMRIYRLEDPKGQLIAGNWPQWPDLPVDRIVKLPSLRYPGDSRISARLTWLPDGSRLLVGFDEIELSRVRSEIRRLALWSAAGMLLFAVAGGLLLTNRAMRPIADIRRTAEFIMAGNLNSRIPYRKEGGELDQLAATLNSMLERIQQLIASVKGATDNIAHDLRSPLTRHRARLEAALYAPPELEQLKPWLENSIADLDRVLATFSALLRIASVESGTLRGEFESFEPLPLLQDAVDLMEPLSEQKQQSLKLDIDAPAQLLAHRTLLFQAVVNLLDNAIKYAPPHSSIELRVRQQHRELQIAVLDAGPGVPAGERQRVFERLYRLDDARHSPGLGLGLSLVAAVAKLHGGRASIDREDGRTLAQLSLPL